MTAYGASGGTGGNFSVDREGVYAQQLDVALLEILLERLDTMAAQLERFNVLLTEFEPVIRAYLDPAASGPVAWAVRRKLR